MANSYEMNASRITVGTLGEPGNRTFYLQGIRGLDSLAVVIEKQQAYALANAIQEMQNELETRFKLPPPRANRIPIRDLELQLPIRDRFRVAQIALGYDEKNDLVLIALQELIIDDTLGLEPRVARFWVTRDQAAALSQHARHVADGGRPVCPLCNEPMSPDGHFCPRSNGHHH
ncbi:MAG: DUF3090 family protein [Ardenticatenaceae bacterium]